MLSVRRLTFALGMALVLNVARLRCPCE
jgi:hypothetical protein